MAGGPSHIDTFDPKPDAPADVRGEFKPIDTSVPGIRISEHFPKFAKLMKHAAILRGMSTLESDHKLATYHLHTGYQNRAGAVAFPSLGRHRREGTGQARRAAAQLREHRPRPAGGPRRRLPRAGPPAAGGHRPGARARLHRAGGLAGGVRPAGGPAAAVRRSRFTSTYKSEAGEAHRSAIDRAVRLMNSEQKRAFDLSREPDAVREAYGQPAAPAAASPARRQEGRRASGPAASGRAA